MKLSATRLLAVPRDRVYASLTQPESLRGCIEGCESLERVGEGSYTANLRVGVGGLKGSFSGKLEIREASPPRSFALVVEGKGVPGWVKGTARIDLLEKGGGTELRCEAEGQVGGLIAAVGSRLVEAAGRRQLEDFLDKLAAQLK